MYFYYIDTFFHNKKDSKITNMFAYNIKLFLNISNLHIIYYLKNDIFL